LLFERVYQSDELPTTGMLYYRHQQSPPHQKGKRRHLTSSFAKQIQHTLSSLASSPGNGTVVISLSVAVNTVRGGRVYIQYL
jgi:hypothetical protein